MTTLPTNRWKLGLFVTLGFLGILLTLGWLGATRLERVSEESHYFFDQEVNGLEIGSPIKFRGVPIGKVVTIRAAADMRHVEVVGEVYTDALGAIGLPTVPRGPGSGLFVPEGMRVELVSSFLTGAAFIQGDFFDPEVYPIPEYPFEVPWNTVHVVPSTRKSLEDALRTVAERIPVLTDELTHVLLSIEETLVGLDAATLSQRAATMMTAIEDFLVRIDELPILQSGGETLVQLRTTLAEMEALMVDLRDDEGPLQRAVDRFDTLGKELGTVLVESQLPETTEAVRDVGAVLEEAGHEVTQVGTHLRGDLEELRRTLTAVRELAALLERDPGALLRGRSSASIPNLDD